MTDHSIQSAYSTPHGCAGLLDEIDPSIEAVSAMARNLVVHYRASDRQLPEHTREDISMRWVDAILATDQSRHPIPLTVDRPIDSRVQGCCRDHTLLAVAAMRHHGVSARSRVGFARYLSPTGWNYDHVIVEAWLNGRWRRFDPELAEPYQGLADPTDIPHGPDSQFLTAAHVWLAHRAGLIDVTRFGVAEGLDIDGDWFVHGYVIAEVAHRFGDELLLWDAWGAMSRDLSQAPSDHVTLVDEIARLLVGADEGDLSAERELLSRYREDDRLRPSRNVRSFSPNGGTFDVDLSARRTTRLE